VIPAPVLVELDQLMATRRHPEAMYLLLDDIAAGRSHVEDLMPEDYRRIRQVIERYADSNIGFVDAAVLAVVERLDEPKLATLDRRHFGILRPRHRTSLTLLPELT
jgi:predicted nucleic acid-binding protein